VPSLGVPHPGDPGCVPLRLQDLERDEENLGEKARVQEELSLIHGFLQAEVQLQLSELEAKLRREELSEERYLAKVKALLRQELSAPNGSGDPNPNGCPGNGASGSDEDEDGAMELEEGVVAVSSSPSCSGPAARARKSRRSRSNGDAKS
ncbi:DNMT1 methyltransferase, partial [Loxia curvirostra]|nr:DNMT1 methyltransferase [Loxia curvirostra]